MVEATESRIPRSSVRTTRWTWGNVHPRPTPSVSIDQRSTRTDRDRRFELTGTAPGYHELVVDGRAVRGGKKYLAVIIGVDIRKQGLTELSDAVYFPRVRAKDWFEVASPTRTEITHTHPDLPGVPLLQIPKDTVFRDRVPDPGRLPDVFHAASGRGGHRACEYPRYPYSLSQYGPSAPHGAHSPIDDQRHG